VDFVTNGIDVLDVVLCDCKQIIYRLPCLPPMGRSDHAVVKYVTAVTSSVYTAAKNSRNFFKYD